MTEFNFTAMVPILEGWSSDKKYKVTKDGTDYLLRISPNEKYENKKELFRIQQILMQKEIPMCRPVEFGSCEEGTYLLQTWIKGESAEKVIPDLSDSEQYVYGLEAGRILKRIHSIPAPAEQMGWKERFNKKIDKKIAMYRDCPIQFEDSDKIIAYIEENRYLLSNRPQCFQHGDYHIGNMMLEDGSLIIIDFDRYDYGDPWEEFNRIVWCAKVSPIFASGLVNGYFDHKVPYEFWRLLALYISSNMLSSIPWAIPYGEGEVRTMVNQAKDVLCWFDAMRNPIPTWYFEGYFLQEIDGLQYKMKSEFNFDFIHEYGSVFKVFDDQDSGNICFGTMKEGKRYFLKVAGAPTERYDGSVEEAIQRLKDTVPLYNDLESSHLIHLIDSKEIGGCFLLVFQWVDGDCMGRMYPAAHKRFRNLPADIRMKVFYDILDFLVLVHEKDYVAIDLYDGSILYDFENRKTTICDIDLFGKKPYINSMGRMWGSSRFMSPEELEKGAVIDEITNVYTAGAMAFALFSEYERDKEHWPLQESLYEVVSKATRKDRGHRQQSIKQFLKEWKEAMD